ncbi:DNA-directed RNA polymerase subunit alpha [Candidatus Gottesmanbacteria bacterium]|nr:DNA-directed RNA polymerase subunit alpha [Candidatus Gottesmanbacteria bacterium]
MLEPNFQIKPEVEKPEYGKFVIEPLEQGYGQTLGNTLRRVLLTSLTGAAITSVKIAGVKHQFTTIPGVKEDVTELILNIKKIRLVLEGGERAVMTLSKKGPGVVTAGDFDVPAGITVVNPDFVLATLADKKSTLDIEVVVEKGYGYVSADERHLDEVGVIPVDALFCPVVRVNYRVEATRVGRMTNLDRLVIELWTDATIAPLVALKTAAKILVSYFLQVYEPKAAEVEGNVAVTPTISDEILKMRIEELDIPTRIVNALSNGGIETIGQLLGTPKAELVKIKNLGVKSLAVVEEKLREKGVALTV